MKFLHILQAGFMILLLLIAAFADQIVKNPIISEKLTLGTGIILMLVLIKFQNPNYSNQKTSQKPFNW
ncbi:MULTISPECIES: hypothetical protein [unclassified Leeuwenhoekiella]|uniref:hypothetical protein n=1 Tax=unclassified Leeuwenhoekiella TaxID=2615029 RepID=UPI000C69B60B|nr:MULTISPECIES: hypothetical protein [unclassified Leeuwenhoekiella]MAW96907.1 hypothetical protein [Leeuwenhoekiella sp.]MBA80611.1 hypothetical protein [Leeuwenhoekiella sp.]|tara:strand:+ start:27254 stop:27457 length:204 start_codon:yes stop_codon:yes gene_type:complete